VPGGEERGSCSGSPRMAWTVGRQLNGGGGGSTWAEEEWKETSVVYYPTPARGVATPMRGCTAIASSSSPAVPPFEPPLFLNSC
jgi:hypothetical protein